MNSCLFLLSGAAKATDVPGIINVYNKGLAFMSQPLRSLVYTTIPAIVYNEQGR